MLFNRRLFMFLAFLFLFTACLPAVSSSHIPNHSLTATSIYAYDSCPYKSTTMITEPSLYRERCIRENFFHNQKSTRAAHLLTAGQHWVERFFSGEIASGSTVATKKVIIKRSKSPESAKHLEDAGAVDKPLPVVREGVKSRRRGATKQLETKSGFDRDEAPPAILRRDGDPVTVRHVPSSDNRSAGAQLGNQIGDATEVIIRIED